MWELARANAGEARVNSRLGRCGFTLLEVVVALAMVGIACVAALEAFGAEVRGADQARQALPAAALAQERLGRLALLPTLELAHLPDSLARGTFAPPFDGYGWHAVAGPVLGEQDLYEVRVDVTWNRGSYGVGTRWYRPPPVPLVASP
jgi:prepilin-type N-terminal cleavage/methylation domain-containing protein